MKERLTSNKWLKLIIGAAEWEILMWLAAAGILTGLFTERAVPSIAMFTIIGAALFRRGFGGVFRAAFRDPLFWMISTLILLPLLSGLWSENIADWWKRIVLKAPLLVVPLAMAGMQINQKWYNGISLLWIGVVLAGCGWSLGHYVLNMAFYQEAYLKAKVIPTPFFNDHLRFSWVVVAMLLLLVKLWRNGVFTTLWQRISAGGVALFFVAYLHILSARTGLLSLYLAAGVMALAYIVINKRYLIGGIMLLLMALMPVLAWHTSATFRNRINFVRYDFFHFTHGAYNEGLSDAPRIYSLRAGWSIFTQHPHTGIGYGDIMPAAMKWYAENAPQLPEYEKLLPGSNWLLYAAGMGWPGWLIFMIAATGPFFLRQLRRDPTWLAFWATCWLAMLYEIPVDGQVGVALYALLPMWWSKGENLKV